MKIARLPGRTRSAVPASTTVTGIPSARNASAAVRPTGPAPTTIVRPVIAPPPARRARRARSLVTRSGLTSSSAMSSRPGDQVAERHDRRGELGRDRPPELRARPGTPPRPPARPASSPPRRARGGQAAPRRRRAPRPPSRRSPSATIGPNAGSRRAPRISSGPGGGSLLEQVPVPVAPERIDRGERRVELGLVADPEPDAADVRLVLDRRVEDLHDERRAKLRRARRRPRRGCRRRSGPEPPGLASATSRFARSSSQSPAGAKAEMPPTRRPRRTPRSLSRVTHDRRHGSRTALGGGEHRDARAGELVAGGGKGGRSRGEREHGGGVDLAEERDRVDGVGLVEQVDGEQRRFPARRPTVSSTAANVSPGRPVSTGFRWKVIGGNSSPSRSREAAVQLRHAHAEAPELVGEQQTRPRLAGDDPDSGRIAAAEAGRGEAPAPHR